MTREEAIETIRMCCPKVGDSQCYFESAMRELIPELADSEDEKIRKAIIGVITKSNAIDINVSHEKMIAWLEKQKENIREYVFRPVAGTDITIAAEQAIKRTKEGDHLVLAFNGMYLPVRECSAKEIVDKYEAYLEKQKEQKPVERSEEDDALLKEIVSFFKDGTVKLQHDLDLYAGFLEKKFKSLRSQPHWKPSEEQMEALMLAIEGKGPAPTSYLSRRLEDLYEGLANAYGVECDLKEVAEDE